MSDDSISYGEDKENLLYISKKINVDEFGMGEEGPFKESDSDLDSDASVKPAESEIKILEHATGAARKFSDPLVARKLKPFHLKWAFGMNGNVGFINLSSDTRKELFFSSVHSAIIYNYCTREMRHLEGHQYIINCISSDNSGDWLVSCDGDKEGCLIVWSSKDLSPIFTLFNLYPESGIILTEMSPCARYLITIGENSFEYYSIDFWLWTMGGEQATDTYLVHKVNGLPVKICYNPDIEEHIMLVFEKQVFLIIWDPISKKIVPSVIPHITNKTRIGELTSGTYMKECHESYASSSRGCILVFRNTLYGRNYDEAEPNNSKMYINAVKVSPASIGAITTIDGMLVVGDSKGHILFFDKRMKILYWLRNIGIGAITAIRFSLSPKTYQYENSKIIIKEKRLEDESILDCDYQDLEGEITKRIEAPFDATLENKPFTVRDFFISTVDCNIYAFDFIRNICTPIFHVADANISCIDAHDERPYIVVGYENGRVALIDFENKELIANYILPKCEESVNGGGDVITCIKYSHESLHLICGRASGEIWVLEPIVLTPKMAVPFRNSHSKIVKIDFSINSLQFAYFDVHRTVLIYNYIPENNGWVFRGKVRSHYEPINDIRFICTKGDKSSVLYTIGADRYMVEYNNLEVRNSEDVEFGTTSSERIEQSAVPLSFTNYNRKIGNEHVEYFLIADDKVLPQHKSRYMIFMTQRHLGIYILPADGNPYKYTGYLAHPLQIADFTLSYHGLYAFSYGVGDRCILQWEVKPRSVELLSIMGGTELEPYYCLLEGGKSGWLFQEIQDLFFYMQILQQENIDLPRRVSDTLSLTEIPDLVRTCGYYPSHFELETMMIDIRYRDFDESGIVRDEITFVEFVKLFINHRPAYGYSLEDIRKNFNTVCMMADYPRKGRIESHDLIYLLQTVGEPSSNLHKNLVTLLRIYTFGENNYEFLPNEISTRYLFYELLGIDTDEVQEPEVDHKPDETGFRYFSI